MDKELQKEAMQTDVQSLKGGIEKCNKNILIFEEAIEKEQKTKKRFREMIAFLERRLNGNQL